MKIHIEFDPETETALARAILDCLDRGHGGEYPVIPAVAEPEEKEEAPVPAATAAPIKRGPGRPRKDGSQSAPKGGVSLDDLRTALNQALEASGQEAVEAVFKKFKAGKLSDLPMTRHAEFLEALTNARAEGMAG